MILAAAQRRSPHFALQTDPIATEGLVFQKNNSLEANLLVSLPLSHFRFKLPLRWNDDLVTFATVALRISYALIAIT